MKAHLALVASLVLLAAGCDGATGNQPPPTADAGGTLTVPKGYQPGPQTDLSRVDCPEYLAMTPADMRAEIKRLCEGSATAAERAGNPMCEAQRITEHCERTQAGGRP